jgi:crotonobetainyl-CoA:carnitine CoA-transferase CaiB-like acyl-CoA transferase
VEVAASAQELGLAVAVVADADRLREGDEQLVDRGTLDPRRFPVVHRATPAAPVRTGGLDGLVVVDLSSLWAGPTCARLLGRAGATVVKVESTTRPDGARNGNRELFERLHAGHHQRSIPFEEEAGRHELRRVLATADVVIEGSRPRAMDRLGIDPVDVVAGRPGAVWVSITAYGRTGPWRDRVGFGDDCAAAGGLVRWTADGSPAFVGDAMADPLTGMVAAALAARALADGGGVVLDVALREVARAAALEVEPQW